MTLLSVFLEDTTALLVALPLLGAFSAPLVGKVSAKARNLWVIAIMALAELAAVSLLVDVLGGNPHFYAVGASDPALPSAAGFPFRIVLVADAMSALVAALAMTMALLSVIYSLRYESGNEGLEKYYSLVLLLAGAMMGLCLTGDFFTLFVFLEIASISSAGLIAFFSSAESFEAAFKYMVVSASGALFLLFGVGMLYGQYGMLNMASIGDSMAAQATFVDLAALSLLVSALLLKSGSVPVHMWKPDAYQEAPPQVVVMLVSFALLSLYLIFRICFSVFGAMVFPAIGWTVAILGALSIFVGVVMAVPQRNLRRLIGYAAIAEIGYVMLGVGTSLLAMHDSTGVGMSSMHGGIFHMLNDAIDMGLLLLVVGAVTYATKRQELDQVSGLAHRSGALAALFLIGVLSIAGLPPLNGFASKVIIYESVFRINPMLSVIGILGSIMMLAVFVKIFASVFLGAPYKGCFRKIPRSMLIPMVVLAVIMIFIGLFPGLVLERLVFPAAEALLNQEMYFGGVL
ncbi:MAG: NADH:ubiquinone oxidoreductase [Candidatus Aenigmarchaeota archaeon]|nr:NADH:ubiquinone oxidoreductase [Candidatus Aenigmarchaeota archaeon]